MQEGTRIGFDVDFVAPFFDAKPVQGFYGRRRLAKGRTERCEIMLADKYGGGCGHRVDVKFRADMPDAARVKGAWCAPVQDAIAIAAFLCRMAGVKAGINDLCIYNDDRMRA